MKLYNINKDKIVNVKVILTTKGNMIASKITEAERNEAGYYDLVYKSALSRRYYTVTPIAGLVGNKFVTGYSSVEKDLIGVQDVMIKDLIQIAEGKEATAVIITEDGIEVHATESDLNKFERGGKKGLVDIRDTKGVKHKLTKPKLAKIAEDIENNGFQLFGVKWAKHDEIRAFTTIDECIEYEKQPYDYVVTQADVDNSIEGTLVIGTVITKYKNNVKDW